MSVKESPGGRGDQDNIVSVCSLYVSDPPFPSSVSTSSFPTDSKENTAAAFILDYTAPSALSLDPYDSSFVSSKDPFLFSTSTTISPLTLSVLRSTFKFDPVYHVLKYKPVAKKVRPIPTAMPVEFRVDRREVSDPLADLPVLPYHPPPFIPGSRFTAARAEELDLDPAKFLWPAELDLVRWLVRTHETAFAWETSEQGTFREDMFPPLKIPTLPHKPWVE